MNKDTEHEYLLRMSTGDTRAFESLFLAWQPRLVCFLEGFVKDEEAASLVMWREGHLIFQNAPLEEIVLKLEKRYNIRISYNAALYEGRYYYIKFQPHETAEQAIAILAKLIGASYQFNESVVYLH